MRKVLITVLIICLLGTFASAYQLKSSLEALHQVLPEKVQKASLDLQAGLESIEKKASNALCIPCKIVFGYLQQHDFTNAYDKASALIETMCDKYGILGDGVCEGALTEMGPYAVQNVQKRYMDPNFVCPLINVCPEVYESIDIENVVQNILKDAPTNNQRFELKKEETFKFMHMTDLHFDWNYQIGSFAECKEPTCCRQNSTAKASDSMTAGYWGSVAACDLPYRTVEAFVNFVKKNVTDEIDFVIWTGDNTNHFIWEQSQESNINNTIQITQLFQSEIPNLKIIPIMGNHESFPCNVYDYEGQREKELKTTLAKAWEKWIGPEAASQFKEHGFYSTVMNKGNQKLRIIAINTQAGNPLNFFLIKNPTDPGSQLSWLEDQLTIAEKQNEKVYIMGHIPSDELIEEWSEVYNALIQRFSSIIYAQFFGHTHKDHFKIYKDRNTTTINNVAFIAPSVTTYHELNPSFRVYEVDTQTLLPINYYQYRLNVAKYNQMGTKDMNELNFDIAYDFNSEYGFTDMSNLKNFEILSERIKTDLKTYTKVENNYYSGAQNKKYTKISKEVYCKLNSTPYLIGLCKGKYTRSFIDSIIGGWFKKINSK